MNKLLLKSQQLCIFTILSATLRLSDAHAAQGAERTLKSARSGAPNNCTGLDPRAGQSLPKPWYEES